MQIRNRPFPGKAGPIGAFLFGVMVAVATAALLRRFLDRSGPLWSLPGQLAAVCVAVGAVGSLLAGRRMVVWISSDRVSVGITPRFGPSFSRNGLAAVGVRQAQHFLMVRGMYCDGSESQEVEFDNSLQAISDFAERLAVPVVYISELYLDCRRAAPGTRLDYVAVFDAPQSGDVECRYVVRGVRTAERTVRTERWSPGRPARLEMNGVEPIDGLACWELLASDTFLDADETVTPSPPLDPVVSA